MAMRPLNTRPAAAAAQTTRPSLLVQVLSLALSPLLYAVSVPASAASWALRQASGGLQLPLRALVGGLQLADSLIAELLALLTAQPAPKVQLTSYEKSVAALQQSNAAAQRQILVLQHELDGLKLERSKAARRNIELSDKLQQLQQRLSKAEADSQAGGQQQQGGPKQQLSGDGGPAPPASYHAAAPRATAYSPGSGGGGDAVTYDGKRWYLHACVGLASLGVRWWLLHQTDPLQRKVMMVVIWPALWVYGAMVFNCMPNSSTLRASLACFCWALLGYIGHEVVAHSVRGQQGVAARLLTS